MSGKRECACPRVQHEHGTRGAYQQDKCRCLPCCVANSRANLIYNEGGTWRESQRATVGVRRRLQALNTIGWTWDALGQRLGVSRQCAYAWGGGKQRTCVLIHTVRRVAALYDEVWDVYPEGTPAHRARLAAARKGWLPPMCWDDDEIDDPAAAPHMPKVGSRDLAVCGTAAAARRHYRRGEPLCEACKAASKRESVEVRARRAVA